MRIALLDRVTMRNAVAMDNAGRDAVRRRSEDEMIAQLVAAVSARGAGPSPEPTSRTA